MSSQLWGMTSQCWQKCVPPCKWRRTKVTWGWRELRMPSTVCKCNLQRCRFDSPKLCLSARTQAWISWRLQATVRWFRALGRYFWCLLPRKWWRRQLVSLATRNPWIGHWSLLLSFTLYRTFGERYWSHDLATRGSKHCYCTKTRCLQCWHSHWSQSLNV